MNNIENFPVTALGNNLSTLVIEIHQETGAPISSIVSAILIVISLVCQGRTKIRKRPGLVSPTALWFIVILGSGERKSAVLNKVLKAVYEFCDEQALAHTQRLAKYEAELRSWKAEGKGILASIYKKSISDDPIDEEQHRLKKHYTREPQKPKRFKLIHERVTPQALIKNLSECYPTTGLISDDGAVVFNGRGMSELGLLTKAFDGSNLVNDRSTEGEQIAHDPSFTLALYTQKGVCDAFFQGKGELARSVGLLARCYFITPPEAAGYRAIAYSRSASADVLNHFNYRCLEILRSHIDDESLEFREKAELYFSPEAQYRWEQEHDRIEAMMQPGGFFFNDKDFASKHADKIARLAALFSYFEGNEGPISLETLERSIVISNWYACEFVRNFAKPIHLPQEQADAQPLLKWLANYVRVTGLFIIKKNDLLIHGPNSLRDKMRLNATLIFLWQQNIAREVKFPNDKTCYIQLNPEFFTPNQVHYLCAHPG
jgi:hypothetical protein